MPSRRRYYPNLHPKRGKLYRKNIFGLAEFLTGWIDPDITVKRLCFTLKIHRSTLNRAFKENLGVSPGRYIRKLKFDMARGALQNEKGLLLKNLFIRLGYANFSSASRAFKKYVGVSPRDIKRAFSDHPSAADHNMLKRLWKNQVQI